MRSLPRPRTRGRGETLGRTLPLDRRHSHEVESWSAEDIAGLQNSLFKQQLDYLWERSAFYSDKLGSAGLSRGSISSLDELRRAPFTTKDEIRRSLEDAPPLGNHVAADPSDVMQFHASSGTTGRPSYIGLTQADVADWTEIVRRSYWTVGFRPKDRVLQALGMSRAWVGGLPLVQGLQALGAGVIPGGAEPGTAWLLNVIRDLSPTGLVATPTFATYLGQQSEAVLGVPARELSIERIYVGGEPGGGVPSTRNFAEQIWDAEMREVMGGTDLCTVMWAECEDRTGMHFVAGDSVHFEIISLDDQEPQPIEKGVRGELVYTHLKREATPVLRFKHADIVEVTGTSCSCGRTSPKIRCFGRTDDMFIVKGVNVYPTAIQDIVMKLRPEVTGSIRILKESASHSIPGPLKIRVEKSEGVAPGDEASLVSRIESTIRELCRCNATVELVPPGTYPSPGREKTVLVEKVFEMQGGQRSDR